MMTTILGDTSKIVQVGPVDIHDSIKSIENKKQKLRLKWVKSDALPASIADLI